MSPEQLVSWWIGTLIDILPESCCSILHVRLWLLTSAVLNQLANSRLANSYNLDEAVALKVKFVLYILPQIQEIV